MSDTYGNIVTFYSYKGGTGRTMAVANAGYALASQTRGEVLMIDWDLEAPGLPDFFPELGREREREPRPGVLELFEGALEVVERGERLGAEDAQRFWREMDLPGWVERTDAEGLHMLRSGLLDETYGDRVRGMRWQQLFELWPDLFRAFAEEVSARYRFVLIDSRTGLSDTAGICTSLLPDRLVAVFTPNRQSLTGVTETVRRAVAYRGRSPDLRRLLVFPLASRVELSEEKLRHEWRYGSRRTAGYQPCFQNLFEEIYDFGECDLEDYFDEVQVQHATSYAYGERVAMREEDSDRLSLSRSYERFTRVLRESEGPWAFRQAGESRPASTEEPEADRVLEGLEKSRLWHARRARQARQFDLALLIGAAVILLAGLIVYLGLSGEREISPPFTPWVGTTLLLTGLFVGIRAVAMPHRRYALHARAANALERESLLFGARGGPYMGEENPVALLAERVASLQADADDALLDLAGSPPRMRR